MAEVFSFEEIPDSQPLDALGRTDVRRYVCSGTVDRPTVYASALVLTDASISTEVGTLYRQNITIEPDGWGQWIVEVPYGAQVKSTGQYSFNFDTTGETAHVNAAREHIETYDDGGATSKDLHKAAINVTGDGSIEGADIVVPGLRFSISYRYASGVVNLAFARNLSENTGKTNSDSWLGFAAGELLFLGATGSDGSDSEAEVTLNFAASENVTNLAFGDITGITKGGHQLFWVEGVNAEVSGEAAVQPKYVHIERMYDSTSFATLFGFS